MQEGEYKDGKKDGYWVTYFANGNKMSEGHYVLGKKEGLWILYWQNGNKKSEGAFKDGVYTGQYTSYHENGNRRHQGYYNEHRGVSADGWKEGAWYYYDEDGETVNRIITYKRGARSKPDEYPKLMREMEDRM